MILQFIKNENGVKRLNGYGKGFKSHKDSDGNEIGVFREVSESELNKLIPDSFEETDWKEVRRHYKLESGEVVFDEGYEPETEDEE